MTDKELKELTTILQEAEVPLKNRWGLDEDGELVQFTDEEGNILI